LLTVDVRLLHLRILENLLNGLQGLLEKIVVQLLELSPSKGLREILALVERLNLDLGGLLGRKRTLGLLNLALELTHGLRILCDVHVLLLVVFLSEVADDTVIEIFTTEVSVTSGSLDLEYTLLNSEDGDIESSTTQIVDDDLSLLLVRLVKTVGEGGGGGLVDYTQNVEAGDSTSVLEAVSQSPEIHRGMAMFMSYLGGGTLGVVEVGRDSDNGVLDSLAEVALSDLLHLSKNHSGNLLGCESRVLAVNRDLDTGLTILANDLEREVLDVVLNLLLHELAADQTFLPGR
jgi:hypothetical protein